MQSFCARYAAARNDLHRARRHLARQTLTLVFALGSAAVLTTDAYTAGTEPVAAQTNQLPNISFLWPINRAGAWPPSVFPFGYSTRVKLKVAATDADGMIAAVRFYAGTNLLGTVTNSPFNLVWSVYTDRWTIKAIVIDNLGAQTETTAGTIVGLTGRPPEAYVEIVWPTNGAMFAAPASFDFAAEVMAGGGATGPLEFLINNNVVGQDDGEGFLTATTPPSVITISNLPEGNHTLGVRWLGSPQCFRCWAVTNLVRVVKLGVHSPRIRSDGARQFEVATSYPGKRHVIEESHDLMDWCLLGTTNAPATNSFTFTVPGPAPAEPRYYRVVVTEP